MVQARLEGLDVEPRRVLRAASVFGDAFWPGGVAALVGIERSAIERTLQTLERAELIAPSSGSRFAGERQLGFRHALVREGAYAMLTREDRMLGHRLAGEWLERAGEADAVILAEHAERAGDAGRTAPLFARAARASRRRSDMARAITRADRGIGCRPPDETLASLRAIQSEANLWRGHFADARDVGEEAMRLSAAWSDTWCRALMGRIVSAMYLGRDDDLKQLIPLFRDVPAVSAKSARVLFAGINVLYLASEIALADACVERIEPIVEMLAAADTTARAWLEWLRGLRAVFGRGDVWLATLHHARAIAGYEELHSWRHAAQLRMELALYLFHIGAFTQAEGAALAAVTLCERHDVGMAASASRCVMLVARAFAHPGEVPSGEVRALIALAGEGPRRNPLVQAFARTLLLELLFRAEDWAAIEAEAPRSTELLFHPAVATHALSLLSIAHVRQRRPRAALDAAREAARLVARHGPMGGFDLPAGLALGEALRAAGDDEGARLALTSARSALTERASRIGDDDARRAYLVNVRAHARLLDLARTAPDRVG
jgi:tetratricopeptide (TPR) repeat protein